MKQAHAANKMQESELDKKDEYTDVKPVCSKQYYEGNMNLEVRQRESHVR